MRFKFIVWTLIIESLPLFIPSDPGLVAQDSRPQPPPNVHLVFPDGPRAPILTNTVYSSGITWTFDKDYKAGIFVNGDWWVVGPVNLVSVLPKPANGFNGSMINPSVGKDQGYDKRATNYNPALSVSLPLQLLPGQSLVSTESRTTSEDLVDVIGTTSRSGTNKIRRAAVLTCVSGPVSNTMFRPPYIGSEKLLFDSVSIRYDLLLNLSPQSTASMFVSPIKGTSRCMQYANYFKRVWLLHKIDDMSAEIRPCEHQPEYYSVSHAIESDAALLLLCNYSDKQDLLINFIQYGIDCHYASLVPGSADRCLSKWPAVFAGIMLDNEKLRNVSNPRIKTEMTYYGKGWTGATALWRGYSEEARNYENMNPFVNNSWCTINKYGVVAWKDEAYRRATHSWTWVGTALAARLMNAKSIWNHDAFFDYIERWMTEDESSWFNKLNDLGKGNPCGTGNNYTMLYQEGWTGIGGEKNFVKLMWNAYR